MSIKLSHKNAERAPPWSAVPWHRFGIKAPTSRRTPKRRPKTVLANLDAITDLEFGIGHGAGFYLFDCVLCCH